MVVPDLRYVLSQKDHGCKAFMSYHTTGIRFLYYEHLCHRRQSSNRTTWGFKANNYCLPMKDSPKQIFEHPKLFLTSLRGQC